MAKRTSLAEKYDEINDRIAAACERAGRDRKSVALVAVTKYAAPEQVRELVRLGHQDFAENYVQPLVQRASQLNEFHQRRVQAGDALVAGRLRWHMIGHLQRNKVKQTLPHVAMVQSVDSLRLAEEIDTVAEKLGIEKVPVLLQVNASEEKQKYGVAVGAAVHLGEQIDTMPHVQLMGLMTLAAYGADEATLRQVFTRTREVFDEMKWHKIGGEKLRHLSMGMSDDFEIAIEEGATLVRIGSALFVGELNDADDAPA